MNVWVGGQGGRGWMFQSVYVCVCVCMFTFSMCVCMVFCLCMLIARQSHDR